MEVLELSVDDLQIHHSKWINERHVQRLLHSINDEGILAPLMVAEEQGMYTVISGAHRLEAARQLGFATVPCIVLSTEEHLETLVLQLDGIQRQNNPMQEGQLLRTMLNLGYTQEQIAKMVDKSPSWVQHRVALVTTLAVALQTEVAEGTLSSKKAQDIARLPILEQEKFAAKVKLEKLSAKKVAKLVALYNRPSTDEQMKQCIINTPTIALAACSKRRSPRKVVSPTVRGFCNCLDEILQQVEDFQTTIEEEGLSDAERRELQDRIAQVSALLGQLQSVVSGEGAKSTGQVCVDPEGPRWPDDSDRAVSDRTDIQSNCVSVPASVQDGTPGWAETPATVRCWSEQGLESGTGRPNRKGQERELQTQCRNNQEDPRATQYGDQGSCFYDPPGTQTTQHRQGMAAKDTKGAFTDGLQGPHGSVDGGLLPRTLSAPPKQERKDAPNASMPLV